MEYKNFSKGTLTSQLSDVGTSLTITTTETFPTTGQFKAVIWGAEHSAPQEDSTREILTLLWDTDHYDIIGRGEEGTVAKTWAAGSFIAHIVTAEQYAEYEAKQDTLSEGAFVDGDKTKLDNIESGAEVNEFSDGGEAGGADRTLGNTDNFDLGFLTNNLNRLHIQNNGNIGIGTTDPDTLLTLANNNYLSAKSYSGIGSVNIIKINEDNEIDIETTINIPGNIQGAENGGAITLFDMPVTDAPTAGDEMSVTLKVGGQNILKIYAEADGLGGVQNLKVKPLTTLETVQGTTTMAPIKMQSGTLLTTEESGTIEYDGTDFYISI
jgi:hypothetical protein